MVRSFILQMLLWYLFCSISHEIILQLISNRPNPPTLSRNDFHQREIIQKIEGEKNYHGFERAAEKERLKVKERNKELKGRE